ncbi:hypothetical protein CONLIGDRAFT_686759 [Coniochaeta ligniaria NRRL 30616]|uniref:Secreted protein n=1 Tax=Coniochaeta ligniaria NRRL 30616 TaxID=1408157 RepID=A0A1J7J0C0_9PEZI|nr:hypothetical protein CONLIGDRAFT_686759 [Coniochaeta ligniaria NRRL 30616]
MLVMLLRLVVLLNLLPSKKPAGVRGVRAPSTPGTIAARNAGLMDNMTKQRETSSRVGFESTKMSPNTVFIVALVVDKGRIIGAKALIFCTTIFCTNAGSLFAAAYELPPTVKRTEC